MNAIEVKNVTKRFRVYSDRGYNLKERVLFAKRNNFEWRNVLSDVSFSVAKGESIGLIGHNGCGKSTMLKLMSKIMYPDSGTISIIGRVSSLIELAAGFHPDMSGRQNIYTNAAIFGLTRKEIDERIQDIIDFSEIEEFIDNPVRTYSSGMYMRLAFSVAINVDADILLIDEILAVGDANFQAKCLNKLREIKASGTTIVIVSHSLGQIEQICDKSVWIQDGRVFVEGTPRDVHPRYMGFMGEQRQLFLDKQNAKDGDKSEVESEEGIELEEEIEKPEDETKKSRWGNGQIRISKIELFDLKGNKQQVFRTGDSLTIRIEYKVKEPLKDAVLGLGVFRSDGVHCYGTNTRIEQFETFGLLKSGSYKIKIEHLELLPGEYYFDFAIETGDSTAVDYYTRACKIDIFDEKAEVGICKLWHTWEI